MCEDIHRQAKGEHLNEIDHFLEDAEGLFNEALQRMWKPKISSQAEKMLMIHVHRHG